MRLGIMTVGGACPGLHAVIRAAVVRTPRTCDGHGIFLEDDGLGLLESRARVVRTSRAPRIIVRHRPPRR